ncbi:hypothetical protein [Candidatus Regiella endosymbiont of Tuberolachnus salignus]|uniref:hypothetical protein n=1 Tax=Candidatus Regiella endosymbiont of Tuberolachnus salignus TaxID=3077956 RepID=UPI0030CF3791
MNFESRQGGQGDRPMSVDRLSDSVSTRSQRRRNLKGEGYIERLLLLILIASTYTPVAAPLVP